MLDERKIGIVKSAVELSKKKDDYFLEKRKEVLKIVRGLHSKEMVRLTVEMLDPKNLDDPKSHGMYESTYKELTLNFFTNVEKTMQDFKEMLEKIEEVYKPVILDYKIYLKSKGL